MIEKIKTIDVNALTATMKWEGKVRAHQVASLYDGGIKSRLLHFTHFSHCGKVRSRKNRKIPEYTIRMGSYPLQSMGPHTYTHPSFILCQRKRGVNINGKLVFIGRRIICSVNPTFFLSSNRACVCAVGLGIMGTIASRCLFFY